MPKDGGIGASSKRREDARFLTGIGPIDEAALGNLVVTVTGARVAR